LVVCICLFLFVCRQELRAQSKHKDDEKQTYNIEDKKLYCRREAARCFVLLNISLNFNINSFFSTQLLTLYFSATSNNNDVGTLAVDGWDVTFGTARKGLGGVPARPGPSYLYQM